MKVSFYILLKKNINPFFPLVHCSVHELWIKFRRTLWTLFSFDQWEYLQLSRDKFVPSQLSRDSNWFSIYCEKHGRKEVKI